MNSSNGRTTTFRRKQQIRIQWSRWSWISSIEEKTLYSPNQEDIIDLINLTKSKAEVQVMESVWWKCESRKLEKTSPLFFNFFHQSIWDLLSPQRDKVCLKYLELHVTPAGGAASLLAHWLLKSVVFYSGNMYPYFPWITRCRSKRNTAA